MGSCLSTNTAAPTSKPPRISTSTKHHDGGSKSPPPVYEETVKEVLSETPAIPKRRSPSPPTPRIFHGSERILHQNGAAVKKPSDVGSEIHITHSESDSNSTENDGAFHWPRFNYRPFPAELKRENTAGRSPARRSNKSPGRVNPGSGHGRKTGGGESSERRSRSPVIHSDSGSSKTGLSASKSLRKAGISPGRVGYGSGEKIRKGEEEVRESEEMTRPPPTSNDLLENSLVSLECFIFL